MEEAWADAPELRPPAEEARQRLAAVSVEDVSAGGAPPAWLAALIPRPVATAAEESGLV